MLVVAGALIDQDNAVLVQQRPPGKALAGHWEFPGGKVDRGEDCRTALSRELAEELSIIVDPATLEEFSFVVEPRGTHDLILLLYLVRTWSDPVIATEASATAWLAPSQLTSLALAPADVLLAQRLAAHLDR